MAAATGDTNWVAASMATEPVSVEIGGMDKPGLLLDEIADLAIGGYRRLLERVRKEIRSALKSRDPFTVARSVERILTRHQPSLSRLLTDAKLAAGLAGAWGILKHKNAMVLPAREASVVDQLTHGRPAGEAAAIRTALGQMDPAAGPPQPGDDQPIEANGWHPPADPEDAAPIVAFPVIEEAAAELAARQAMTRDEFDALAWEARDEAFTVAGLATAAAVEKVRDAAAEIVRSGDTLKAFDAALPNSFLSPHHMETVFRAATHSSYADGQDTILSNPAIGDYFPYVARFATHDDRVRPDHRKLETCGIQGTNIYRRDDPVFQKYRAPWDYGCRCNDTYLTVRQAADRGIYEAQQWLATGEAPTNPVFVADPMLECSPNWQRLSLAQIGVESRWLSAQRDERGRFIPKGVVGHGPKMKGAPPSASPSSDTVTVEAKAKPDDAGESKFACVMLRVADARQPHYQSGIIPELVWLANEVPTTHLADKGRADDFHITVLYGLHQNDPAAVKAVLANVGPITVKLGKVSTFPPNDDHEFEVIKVDVISEELQRLHAALKKLPNSNQYPKYQPHITLAYVRPGLSESVVGDTAVEGTELQFDTAVFSDREHNLTRIPLKKE